MDVVAYRFKDGERYDQSTPRSPEKWFEIVAVYELGFGGRVTECTPTKLHVTTAVMNCVDHTILLGTEKEMRPFYILGEYAKHFQEGRKSQAIEELIKAKYHDLKTSKLIKDQIAKMEAGRVGMKDILLLMLDFSNKGREKVVSKGFSQKELVPLVQLKWFDKVSEQDILSLI